MKEYVEHSPWPLNISEPPYEKYSKISIIITAYGKSEVTKHAIQSILEHAPEVELIVANNASPDNTLEMLREFPQVIVVNLKENHSVARNRNKGFEAATGDVLAMLDNDTEAQPGGIQKLAEEAWRVGVSCIQSCRLSTSANYIGDTDAYGADYPCGSALFMRRDVWEKVGRLDEQFVRVYCEDADWGIRARKLGYGWACIPEAVKHFEHLTTASLQNIPQSTALNMKRLRDKWLHAGVGKYICIKCHTPIFDMNQAQGVLAEFRRNNSVAHIGMQCQPKQCSVFQNLECLDSVLPISDKFTDYTEFYELQEDRNRILLVKSDQHSQSTLMEPFE